MKCKKVSHNLSAYMDGELPRGLRQKVESHLTACSRCSAELSRLEQVNREAKSSLERVLGAKESPPGLRRGILEAIEPLPRHRPVMVPLRRLAFAGTVVALASGVLVGAIQEVRFRHQRAALDRRILDQGHELAIVKTDFGAARRQLSRSEAMLAQAQAQLRFVASIGEGVPPTTEGETGPRTRAWSPVLSSLQVPGARGLLSNGLLGGGFHPGDHQL